MRSVIVIALVFLLSGCVRTRTVVEYKYLPDPVAVLVIRPDTTRFESYRQFIAVAEDEVNALDSLSVQTEDNIVRSANLEGARLRTWRQAVLAYFRREMDGY